MRYRTCLVTGVEVLHLGGQLWECNAWPPEHWKSNKGRWRLVTPAIDDHLNAALSDMSFGPVVESFVLALEVADFAEWPTGTFAPEGARHSYKTKSRELWCIGKLDWKAIQGLTVTQQYEAYKQCVADAVARLQHAKRKLKDFDVEAFRNALSAILARGKPSDFTGNRARRG